MNCYGEEMNIERPAKHPNYTSMLGMFTGISDILKLSFSQPRWTQIKFA